MLPLSFADGITNVQLRNDAEEVMRRGHLRKGVQTDPAN